MSNSLPMLNGDKTGVGDFSTDTSANMVAAIRDHISCAKPVQVDSFVTQDTKAGILYPCDFDHMYASLAEGTVVERENLEVKHLKELLLLHLDLIQQQSEQLVTKDRLISSLRQENETLRQRLERMDRRVNLHKQRDGLMPPSDADIDRPLPTQSAENTLLVPKLEPNILPSIAESVVLTTVSTTHSQHYRPPTPFPTAFDLHEELRQSPPIHFRELSERDIRISNVRSGTIVPSSTVSLSENESVKRRRTEEREPSPRVPSSPDRPDSPGAERVCTAAPDSDGGDAHDDGPAGSQEEDQRHSGRGAAAWVSCAGRRRRRLHFRHGRSSECESSPLSQSLSPPPSGLSGLRHLSRGLGRRGRRLPRGQQKGRRYGGGSSRRRSGDAFKDVLCTDHAYWTSVGELPSPLRIHDGLSSEYTTVEVPRWRHKVYTSCYAMEGTENLDDEVFSKRHQRYESDERRRKRWDVQRIREQRHVEKLRQQEAARASAAPPGRGSGGHRRGDDNPLASLWPSPEDVAFVEISEKLPVAAFGAPVTSFHPNEFSLPWKWRVGVQEKLLHRSHHSPYANQDGGLNQSRDTAATSGGVGGAAGRH